jgi:hypothetical protein
LLPEFIDRKTCVLTPGAYAPKGKWALRPLTLEEILVAKDFGRIAPGLLAAGRLDNYFLQRLVPGKNLVAVAQRWGCNGGVLSLLLMSITSIQHGRMKERVRDLGEPENISGKISATFPKSKKFLKTFLE